MFRGREPRFYATVLLLLGMAIASAAMGFLVGPLAQ